MLQVLGTDSMQVLCVKRPRFPQRKRDGLHHRRIRDRLFKNTGQDFLYIIMELLEIKSR